MAKLIYITNTSLDGYIEDAAGGFDWGHSDEVFAFITDLIRPIGTYLYGRRLFEKMAFWEGPMEGYPPQFHDFAAVWQQAGKIVFSRTLTAATTRHTRIERDFDADAVATVTREATHDLTIGGAELAALALDAGLVDECQLFVHPVLVGGGKPAFHPASQRTLELLETRRFDSGVVYVRYRVRTPTAPSSSLRSDPPRSSTRSSTTQRVPSRTRT